MLVDFKTFLKDAVVFSLKLGDKVYNGVYNNCRVDRRTLPNNVYAYDVRDTDSGKRFATIEDKVLVNFGGSIILLDKIDFGKKAYLPLTSKISWTLGNNYKCLKGTALEKTEEF